MQCQICPMKCELNIEENKEDNSYKVSGNRCPQGQKYALKEMTEPSRVVFSRVLLDSGPMSRLHVKTDDIVPSYLKDKFIEIIENTRVKAPVSKGAIIIEDIMNTGINVISTRKVNKI
ncbi:DUF1667 domain-containing protein [Tissierella creatinophila]|uniref:4Fe-4S Mo/W bis-MGD-type domain-containing protein n=1 Tax=Tissierella creatinophila DSM 6911 TaxID=1123403 RepID=A0A1U7M8A2_TISCR|nr:DUF1667 domain-containing protein [Tissierella creatinophila]OLS03439.1 hypothetical protein TICRE_05510 [Tissierella creatinophila DSM 6911]